MLSIVALFLLWPIDQHLAGVSVTAPAGLGIRNALPHHSPAPGDPRKLVLIGDEADEDVEDDPSHGLIESYCPTDPRPLDRQLARHVRFRPDDRIGLIAVTRMLC